MVSCEHASACQNVTQGELVMHSIVSVSELIYLLLRLIYLSFWNLKCEVKESWEISTLSLS